MSLVRPDAKANFARGAWLVGILCALFSAGAWAADEEFLWESFETDSTWAVESARGPVKLEKAPDHATEGKLALKMSFEPADRTDFEVRREVRMNLSQMKRFLVDVTVDSWDIQMAIAFRTTPGSIYYESAPAHLIMGLNRSVSFPLDFRDFNRFKNPIGEPLQGRDDVRRVSLVFWRDKAKTGEIFVDNIRVVGSPEATWETFVPRINSVRQDELIVPIQEILEVRVDFQASFGDFFDPEDISLWATLRDPNGRAFEVPGFLARFEDSKDSKTKEPVWLIRIAPKVVGKYEYTVTVRNAMGERISDLKTFSAVETKAASGFIRVSRQDPRQLERDSGESFFPVGHNVSWANDYEYYFRKLSAAGESLTRIWICPWNVPIEKKSKLGEYDLDQAARLDSILAAARKYNVQVMLVLQYHGMLNASSWADNPYNAKNGGPCVFASDYFTNAKARKQTKKFLRYAAGRWGAYSSLMCWELMNEVDLTDYYDADDVVAWHREMGAYLKRVDGHAHLVTTSAVREGFYENLWKLPEMDFNTGHIYSATLADAVLRKAVEASVYGKPFLVAECAGGIRPEDDQKDPQGVKLHAALWSSFLSPAAGATMPWWWDTHIEPNNLYGQFAGLAAFARDEDRRGRNFTSVRTMIDVPAGDPKPALSGLGPPRKLAVQGLLDNAGGYLWVYSPSWVEKEEGRDEKPFAAGAVVNLTGLLDGDYAVETWTTVGARHGPPQRLAAKNGTLTVSLPAFSHDVAVKVRFLGTSAPAVKSAAGLNPTGKPAEAGK
jgi:hypothetical protein